MGFFRSDKTTELVAPPIVPKPSVIDGWSERELASVYTVAQLRNLNPRESLLEDVRGTDSFYLLLEGAIQVVVKWDDNRGRPGVFRAGDCIAPLPKSSGLKYCAEAVETSRLIEITPSVMNMLPDRTQLAVYKTAIAATSRINAYIRAVNGEVSSNNALLASYIERQNKQHADALKSDFVRNFLAGIPRMPAYGMDLMVKLMDDRTSVQEVVDGIKTDPSVAGIVLRAVNSARFSFHKKIESFYHATMILGMNNIYNLVLQEALMSAMPETEHTKQIHRHSCLITTLCNEIAISAKDTQAQTAATIGLLHDVGKGVQVLMKQTHPNRSAEVDSLESAGLGAELLRLWGIPARICDVIEHQQQPEFTHPDQIPAEYRRESIILYVAHILEGLLLGETIAPECRIYVRDCMMMLRLPGSTPEEFLKSTVLPNLIKNRNRLPQQVLELLPPDSLSTIRTSLS